jgi:hypothetical protein
MLPACGPNFAQVARTTYKDKQTCPVTCPGVRSVALSIHNLGVRRWWVANTRLRPLYPLGRDPVLFIQVVGWASDPVWTGMENLAPTGVQSPDLSTP